MSAVEALGLIKNGDTVTTSGFHGSCVAEDLIIPLGQGYLKNQTPKNLTLVYYAGQGDFKTTGPGYKTARSLYNGKVCFYTNGSRA